MDPVANDLSDSTIELNSDPIAVISTESDEKMEVDLHSYPKQAQTNMNKENPSYYRPPKWITAKEVKKLALYIEFMKNHTNIVTELKRYVDGRTFDKKDIDGFIVKAMYHIFMGHGCRYTQPVTSMTFSSGAKEVLAKHFFAGKLKQYEQDRAKYKKLIPQECSVNMTENNPVFDWTYMGVMSADTAYHYLIKVEKKPELNDKYYVSYATNMMNKYIEGWNTAEKYMKELERKNKSKILTIEQCTYDLIFHKSNFFDLLSPILCEADKSHKENYYKKYYDNLFKPNPDQTLSQRDEFIKARTDLKMHDGWIIVDNDEMLNSMRFLNFVKNSNVKKIVQNLIDLDEQSFENQLEDFIREAYDQWLEDRLDKDFAALRFKVLLTFDIFYHGTNFCQLIKSVENDINEISIEHLAREYYNECICDNPDFQCHFQFNDASIIENYFLPGKQDRVIDFTDDMCERAYVKTKPCPRSKKPLNLKPKSITILGGVPHEHGAPVPCNQRTTDKVNNWVSKCGKPVEHGCAISGSQLVEDLCTQNEHSIDPEHRNIECANTQEKINMIVSQSGSENESPPIEDNICMTQSTTNSPMVPMVQLHTQGEQMVIDDQSDLFCNMPSGNGSASFQNPRDPVEGTNELVVEGTNELVVSPNLPVVSNFEIFENNGSNVLSQRAFISEAGENFEMQSLDSAASVDRVQKNSSVLEPQESIGTQSISKISGTTNSQTKRPFEELQTEKEEEMFNKRVKQEHNTQYSEYANSVEWINRSESTIIEILDDDETEFLFHENLIGNAQNIRNETKKLPSTLNQSLSGADLESSWQDQRAGQKSNEMRPASQKTPDSSPHSMPFLKHIPTLTKPIVPNNNNLQRTCLMSSSPSMTDSEEVSISVSVCSQRKKLNDKVVPSSSHQNSGKKLPQNVLQKNDLSQNNSLLLSSQVTSLITHSTNMPPPLQRAPITSPTANKIIKRTLLPWFKLIQLKYQQASVNLGLDESISAQIQIPGEALPLEVKEQRHLQCILGLSDTHFEAFLILLRQHGSTYHYDIKNKQIQDSNCSIVPTILDNFVTNIDQSIPKNVVLKYQVDKKELTVLAVDNLVNEKSIPTANIEEALDPDIVEAILKF